jgi:hypothetical protein
VVPNIIIKKDNQLTQKLFLSYGVDKVPCKTLNVTQHHLQEIGGSVVADSFRLRNRQLLEAAHR